MKLTWISSYTNAVGQYRAWGPLRALTDLGHETRMICLGKEPERVNNIDLVADVLILQRQTDPTVFALLESIPADLRPKVVYEMDDNPWEWHSWDHVHVALGADLGVKVRAMLPRCDAVTVSTPTLARRVRREFPNLPIWVVPNAIDYQLRPAWGEREDPADYDLEGRIVLGWTGSIHHVRDGDQMLQAMPEVFERYPAAVLLLQCDESVYRAWRERLPARCHERVRWSPPVAFDVHPRVYSLFDVNLAPLATTAFNLCKSDLRLIEGGAQGVPYVASHIAPYAEFHDLSGGIGGYLASTPGEWVAGIGKLLDREDVARGQTLARYVRSSRALEVVAGQWEAAFRSVLAVESPPAVEPSRPKVGRNDPCPCGSGIKYKRCHEGAYC